MFAYPQLDAADIRLDAMKNRHVLSEHILPTLRLEPPPPKVLD